MQVIYSIMVKGQKVEHVMYNSQKLKFLLKNHNNIVHMIFYTNVFIMLL